MFRIYGDTIIRIPAPLFIGKLRRIQGNICGVVVVSVLYKLGVVIELQRAVVLV